MYCWCLSGNFVTFSDMFSFKRPLGIIIFASHPTCIFAFCFFVLSVFLVSLASTAWSPFCKCSKTCGGGVKIRTRNCPMPSTRKEKKCQKPTVEIQECNKIVCPGNVFFYYVKCWWRKIIVSQRLLFFENFHMTSFFYHRQLTYVCYVITK